MGKLHEVLAVEKMVQENAHKIWNEAITTFTKKAEHFRGYHKTLKMIDEERQEEAHGVEEHREIVTTVADKLKYLRSATVKYFDTLGQKETTNQIAKADLVVGEEVLLKDAPATLLLGLESRLKHLRGVMVTVPTLDPGIEWNKDESQREGIYKTGRPEATQKQEKVIRTQIVVAPTEQHPAQYEKWTENKVVGNYFTTRWSGCVTPAQKSEWLSRIDVLIRATVKARQRANEAKVVKVDVGSKLFDFVFGE